MRESLEVLLDDQSDRWLRGSRRMVEDYLDERPELRADSECLLDLIFHEVLLRQRAGEAFEVAEYVRRFPDLSTPLRMHFTVHEMLDSIGHEALGDGAPRDPPAEPAASWPEAGDREVVSAGRFMLLRFHARGGLGEVFVARDGELPREVAFKRLQPRHARDADVQARFVREAEITSRLEHPGVVPVYGLCRDGSGAPGYAMRLIHGEPMSVAIERLHERAAPRPDRLPLRRLLGRFVAACHAVAYAHSQGIVHRDLKPSNIMLGPYGETLVIDWGLARAVPNTPTGDAEPLTPCSAGDRIAETQPGELLGTPAFMSPEQAAGRADRVGPASDIYSLGATLYVLLTGATPFADTSPQKLLQCVREGHFPPPRERAADVPRALEAVCLKALAVRPEDRYATAQALADDIDRWLADEPVTAFRAPWYARIARLARHHPAWGAGATVAVVVATIALALLHFARDRARNAELLAGQRQLRAAVSIFHEAVKEAESGDHRSAARTYRSAIDQLEPLLAHDLDARPRMAVSLNNLGAASLAAGDLAGAEAALQRACREFDRLLRAEPDHCGHRHGASAAWRKLGVVHARCGRSEEAETTFQRAIELLRPCVEAANPRHEHVYFLAQVHMTHAEFLAEQGSSERAEAAYRETVRLAGIAVERSDAARAAAAEDAFPEHRRLLADGLLALSRLYGSSSRPDESSAATAAAHECRRTLAGQQLQAGRQFLDDQNLARAGAAFEEVLELLLKDGGAVDRASLAAAWRGLGEVHQRANRPRLAEHAFAQERKLQP